jgi:hypothetical protein
MIDNTIHSDALSCVFRHIRIDALNIIPYSTS